jgi:predicted enzyme related to lactoylglutathione lyase
MNDIQFNHVIIYSTDVSRSLDFYQGVLGFKIVETYDSGTYARLKSPKGNTTIALHKLQGSKRSQKGETQRVVLYFETKNLDAVCKRIVESGVKFFQMPKIMPWGWKHAYLRDPDGLEISLYWAGKKRFEKTSR